MTTYSDTETETGYNTIEDVVPAWRADEICGFNHDDHAWTSSVEIEGGCTGNPGVWSLGGTTYSFAAHCEDCGLTYKKIEHGSQRNPDDEDGIIYDFDRQASWLNA